MAHPQPDLTAARLREALLAFLDATQPTCAGIDYRLVGTGAALLQRVDLPAGDIDILVRERSELDAFAAALASFPCLEPPAWLEHARQYYGNWDVRGVEVGISTVEVETDADTVETLGRGPWTHYAPVPLGPTTVTAVALELRLITELWRNRPDRSEPLTAHLAAHGCDLELIRRGIAGIGLPQDAQDDLITRLGGAPRP